MRPTFTKLSAVGVTPFIPIDYAELSFSIGLGVTLSEDGNLTYTVKHTFDDFGPDNATQVSIARAVTVATVTYPAAHDLSTGDALLITGSGSSVLDSQLDTAGRPIPWIVASTPSTTTLTYTVANSGVTAAQATAAGFRLFPHASLASLTARSDGNYMFPITGCLLNISVFAAGSARLYVVQGHGK